MILLVRKDSSNEWGCLFIPMLLEKEMAAISFILVSCSTYSIVIKYLQIKDESNRYDYTDLNILG